MLPHLANLISHYPRYVLGFWLLVLLISLPFAARVTEVLNGQPDAPPNSVAAAVRELLGQEFLNQDNYSVVLVSRSDDALVHENGFNTPYSDAIAQLESLPEVHGIRDFRNTNSLPLIAPDRSFSISLIGLNSTTLGDAKDASGKIRATLDDLDELEFFLAGSAATFIELEEISEKDAQRAELFGLPISLMVLVIAFGALVASGLPLLVAVTSITLSFAVLFGLGQIFSFAVFTQSIVTMLGLATGIDYALLMVNRFREELRVLDDPKKAAQIVTQKAGKAVAFSGFTVMVGLTALLIPPLEFIRSIGVGAILVLSLSVLVSITALPACLLLLGHNVNRLKVTRREPGQRTRTFWNRRARLVMAHPWKWAIGGMVFLVLLSLPALRMQVADPGALGLAEHTDARQTYNALEQVGLTGLLTPFDIVVDFGSADEGAASFFNPSNIRAIAQYTRDIERLEGIDQTLSPTNTDGVPGMFLFQYYATQELALESPLRRLVEATISQDGRYALIRAYPKEDIRPREGQQIREDLLELAHARDLNITLGGDYVRQLEWTNTLYSNLPLALLIVYVATFVLLGLAFKSILIPIKSIILNTLTVLAAFGVITLIFQFGVFANFFGLSGGIGFIDNNIPIFIFAIVFGLSMDYEVFLVARIYEYHQRGYSDREAVVQALTSTGSVITSAALIMIVVFSLFIFSEVALIKALGLGLTVAVLLDATLVRVALVPAVMILAGKWNWWIPRPVARLSEQLDIGHD